MCDHKEGKLTKTTKPKRKKHFLQNLAASIIKLAILLYVDDDAVIFILYTDMVRGMRKVEQEMRRFGLIMHAGTKKTKSKKEFLYIPGILRTKEIVDDHVTGKGFLESVKQNKETTEIIRKKTQTMSEGKNLTF